MSLVQDSQSPVPPPPSPPAPEEPAVEQTDGSQTAEGAAAQQPDGSSVGAPPPAPSSGVSGGLVAAGVLIGLCIAGGLLALLARRRLLASGLEDDGTASLMDSLRTMLRRGEISQEEFDAAKRSMVAKFSGKGGPGAAARAGGDTPD